MRKLWLLGLGVLFACNAGPLALDAPRGFAERRVVSAAETVPVGVLLALPQLVTLDFGDGETARAWFRAGFPLADAETVRDPVAQMDGAILVVSAADGPMPQAPSGDEIFRILIALATIDSEGVVRFEGIATLRDDRGEKLLVTGAARPVAKDDDLVYFIVHLSHAANPIDVEFEAEMRIILPGP